MSKLYEEIKILHPSHDVNLETRTFYADKGVPVIAYCVGLGGCARVDRLVEGLVGKGYSIRTFSPRNSGLSTGSFTIENLVADSSLVIKDITNKTGVKPYASGHSLNGYALARILGEGNCVERAVLLAPILTPTEQNPKVVDWYLQRILKKHKITQTLKLSLQIYMKLVSPSRKGVNQQEVIYLDEQRFSKKDVFPFLASLYSAQPCSSKMQTPTAIFLAGKTNISVRIKSLNQLKATWQSLQATGSFVEIYQNLNHYFSKRAGFFNSKENKEIIDKIAGFFISHYPRAPTI